MYMIHFDTRMSRVFLLLACFAIISLSRECGTMLLSINFGIFQVSNIFLWLYVYNMVRVAATETSGLSSSEETTVKNDDANNKLATPSPEDMSKHSTGLLLPSEILTHSEDDTNQMELGRKPDELQTTVTVQPEKPKVTLFLSLRPC